MNTEKDIIIEVSNELIIKLNFLYSHSIRTSEINKIRNDFLKIIQKHFGKKYHTLEQQKEVD